MNCYKTNIFRFMRSAAIALAAGAFFGCSEESFEVIQPDAGPESGYITLSMQCVEGTRAPGDDYTEESNPNLRENYISSVTLCLWAKGGDKPDDTAKPDYVQTFSNLDRTQTAEVRVPITTALRNKLFETAGAECHAFVAVNVDASELGKDFTIQELRNLAISSEFSSRKAQPSFAMDGDCVVGYNSALNLATGAINLQRSASKITLALDVDNEIEQSVVIDGSIVTSKWRPDTGAMRVALIAGLAQSTLDPNLDDTPKQGYFFNTPDELNYSFVNTNTDNGNNPPVVDSEGTKAGYPFIQDCPFYSYPHRWSAEPGDYAATYMVLSIPWQQVNDEGNPVDNSWRTCYYQVPAIAADSEQLQLVRNVSYHVYLHVSMLGSFVPETPLEIEDELKYSAAPWGTVNMDVEIPDVRYLVVDQNDYTVNNETSISIPFYTSHETIVTDATMTFYRYNYDDVGSERAVTVTMAKNNKSAIETGEPVFTANFDNESKQLTVSHDLIIYEGYNNNGKVSFTQNDGPDVGKRNPRTVNQWNNLMNTVTYFKKKDPTNNKYEDEYSRVEFKITLQHTDMQGTPNFREEISITQYPGIYIETASNYCPPNQPSFTYSGAQGSTYINTFSRNLSGSDCIPSKGLELGWTVSIGLSTSFYNFNPNIYLVTVTTLPEGTPYRIGDPRSNNVNNNLESSNHYYDPINLLKRTNGSAFAYGYLLDYNSIKSYTKELITNGVNSQLSNQEDKTVWKSTTYHYYYWQLNARHGHATPSASLDKYFVSRSRSGDITVTGFQRGNGINPNSTNRDIQNYYPTLEDNDHKYMIAPKFRICSSYAGTTWILNRELARRRAAAYQEIGYAAGRWRLPTFGEVEYIMELAAQYKIPRLFGTFDYTWWYWCAQGLVCVPSKKSGKPGVTLPNDEGYELPMGYTMDSATDTDGVDYYNDGARDCHRARFVYDEWYWGKADLPKIGTEGSSTPAYTFTWGDKPM